MEQMGKRPGAAKQVAGGKSVGCQTRVRMWIAGPGAFGGRGSFPDGDLEGLIWMGSPNRTRPPPFQS